MAVKLRCSDPLPYPGINIEGLPTIDVSGHEVPLAAYWEVIDLAEAGRSTSQVVNQVLIGTETEPLDRKVMVAIVKSTLENIKIMNNPRPTSGNSNRASVILNHLMPKKIASYRSSRLVHETDLSDSTDELNFAQQKEGKVINETSRIAAQRDSVSKVMGRWLGEKENRSIA